MYKKSIVLLQNKRFAQHVKLLLHRKNSSAVEDYPLLSDVDAIRDEFLRTGNTSNIRISFGRFIKEYGFPKVFIMDYTIDLGLHETEDPDRRKIFNTILISYAILAHAKGYPDAYANIILVADRQEEYMIEMYRNSPAILFKQLHTGDDRVNALIRIFIQEEQKLKEYLNLYSISRPDTEEYTRSLAELKTIIDEINAKIEAGKKPDRAAGKIAMITDDLTPADVVCRATDDRILINGELRDISESERDSYVKKNIYLEGALTVKTMNAVRDRILKVFKVISKINPYKKDERIFIHIPDSSIIDGSFASTMGTFISNTLAEYSGISLEIGPKNCEKLKNSSGFFIVKDYLIKNI